VDDQCELRLTRVYPASPAAVWAVLTEPASLARWLAAPGAIQLVPGGSFEVGSVAGRVREIDPERVLELDWRREGEEPSVVRFELTQFTGGTQLVLNHRRVQEPVGMRYIQGWRIALGRFGQALASSG
jgi:uncharacterized protein YndB with AHSA1/START domain